MNHPPPLAALLAALMLIGCRGTSDAAPEPPGSASFAYHGVRQGQFRARGRAPEASGAHDWVMATRSRTRQQSEVVVQAVDLAERSEPTELQLYFVAGSGDAELAFTRNCRSAGCAGGTVRLGGADAETRGLYVLTSGTLRLRTSPAGELSGTFSGTAVAISGGGAIQVTGGSFQAVIN